MPFDNQSVLEEKIAHIKGDILSKNNSLSEFIGSLIEDFPYKTEEVLTSYYNQYKPEDPEYYFVLDSPPGPGSFAYSNVVINAMHLVFPGVNISDGKFRDDLCLKVLCSSGSKQFEFSVIRIEIVDRGIILMQTDSKEIIYFNPDDKIRFRDHAVVFFLKNARSFLS